MSDKKTNVPLLITILVFFFAILVCIIIFPRNLQTSSLKETLETVLEQKEEGRFFVGKRAYFNSPISDSTFFFKLVDATQPESYFDKNTSGNYAILTRITGLNGPVTVVFYGTKDNLEFAGIAGISDTQTNIVQYGLTENMLLYWKDNLSRILSRGENE